MPCPTGGERTPGVRGAGPTGPATLHLPATPGALRATPGHAGAALWGRKAICPQRQRGSAAEAIVGTECHAPLAHSMSGDTLRARGKAVWGAATVFGRVQASD